MDPELKRWHDMNPEFKRFVDLYTGKVPDEEMWDAYARWRFLKRMEDIEIAEARAEGKAKGFAEGKAEGRVEFFRELLPVLFENMRGDLSQIGEIVELGADAGFDEKAIRAAYDEWLKTSGGKVTVSPLIPAPRPKGNGRSEKRPKTTTVVPSPAPRTTARQVSLKGGRPASTRSLSSSKSPSGRIDRR